MDHLNFKHRLRQTLDADITVLPVSELTPASIASGAFFYGVGRTDAFLRLTNEAVRHRSHSADDIGEDE